MARPLARGMFALVVGALGAGVLVVSAPAAAHAKSGIVPATVKSGRAPLNLRAAPTTGSAVAGSARDGSRLTLVCRVTGQFIRGRVRNTDLWDRTADGRYVSDAYIKRSVTLRQCPPPPPPPPPPAPPQPVPPPPVAPPLAAPPATPGSWVQPVPGAPGGGFRTSARPDHDGVDIGMPRNTTIRAAAAGTVITVTCNTSTPTCNVDGSPNERGCGWYLEILHPGPVITRYCHLVRRPEVAYGQSVTAGQVIGFVGSSGRSSGPHLHYEVHVGAAPANRANAVDPIEFMQRVGAPLGSPVTARKR